MRTLTSLHSYMFRVGGNHLAVKHVKQFLNSHHEVLVSDLKQNNIFCSKTSSALAQFQKSQHLIPTGRMDLKTWSAIGKNMHPAQISILSTHNKILRDLLTFGQNKRKASIKASSNNAFIRSKSITANRLVFPSFVINLFLSVFAPFDWFGPFNMAKGDGKNRRFGHDIKSSYRIRGQSEILAVNNGSEYPYTVTRASDASFSTTRTPLGDASTLSEAYINDPYTGQEQPDGLYTEKSGVDYHL